LPLPTLAAFSRCMTNYWTPSRELASPGTSGSAARRTLSRFCPQSYRNSLRCTRACKSNSSLKATLPSPRRLRNHGSTSPSSLATKTAPPRKRSASWKLFGSLPPRSCRRRDNRCPSLCLGRSARSGNAQFNISKQQACRIASLPAAPASTVCAALLGGLGITARTPLNLSEGLLSAGSLFGLPSLGSLPVTLHRKADSGGGAADRMAALLVEALKFILLSRSKVKGLRNGHNGPTVMAAGGRRNA
jgi:hypothetical protein